jgi:pimeloyl-ACP methyl ester carboxylesterase
MVKVWLIIVIVLACIVVVFLALTYPRYHREMRTARECLLAHSQVLNTDLGQIECSVKGQGMPVLLLHGAGGGYDQGLWLGKISLGEGYRFISVSRFGYLRSPIPEDASTKAQAALYIALLNHLTIDRVLVVAGSAGGPSALQFAFDYPDRCSGLILLSARSMFRAPGDKEMFYVKIIHLIQQSDFAYWLLAKFFQSLILELMGVPTGVYENFTPRQKELAQEMLDIMHPMRQRHKGTIHDGEMILLDSVSMAEISVPALIIHAKDDALVSYEHAEYVHKSIEQSKLILFDTGGHALLSKMDEIREYARDFSLEGQVPCASEK